MRQRRSWAALAAALLVTLIVAVWVREVRANLTWNALALPVAGAAAAWLVAAAWNTPWRSASFWCGLALVGHVAALHLIDVRREVAYQHYLIPPDLASRMSVLALLVVGAQTLLVIRGIVPAMPAVRRWLADALTLRGAIAVALVFVLTTATFSRSISRYVAELGLATLVQIVALANVIVLARAVPAESARRIHRWGERLLGGPGPHASTPPAGALAIDRFSLVLAGATVAVCALLAVASYQRHPHVPDEVVYLLHARYFADGMLWMPPPPVPASIDIDLMTYEPTRWYSPVPPAWPAVLAIGAALRVPWLVNPVLAGLCVLLAYAVLNEIYDRRTARLATLLLALSPWFLFLGMSFMTHMLTLACALIAALGVAYVRRSRSALPAFAAGLATGVVGLIRPLEGLVTAVLLGLWSLPVRGRAFRFAPTLALVIGTTLSSALVLPYNMYFTGSPTRFPIMAYTDAHYGPGTNALGFGANRGLGWTGSDPFPGHGAVDVVFNTAVNSYLVNVELFGWACGSLLIVALVVAYGSLARADRLMLGVIAAVVGTSAFYWFHSGPDFGARYWFLIIVPCVALAARGIRLLANWAPRDDAGERSGRVLAGALVLCLLTVLVFVPWRAVEKYRYYRGMRPGITRLAAEKKFGRSLVLVRGSRHPDYLSAAIYNPLDLTAAVPIYAWDRTRQIRADIVRAYPDRPIWIVDGPRLAGGPYRIVAGPLPPGSLAEHVPSSMDLINPETAPRPRTSADSTRHRVAITNVTVIDGTDAPPARGVTVHVVDGRIAEIEQTSASALPRGTTVIDGTSKYLIPGLWDMHVHQALDNLGAPDGVAGNYRYLFPLFLANGITGVRDMGGDLATLQSWRRSMEAGALLGPRIVATGQKLGNAPVVDGAPYPVETAADIDASIQLLADAGADFVKVGDIAGPLLPTIADAARRRRLQFAGHVPLGVRVGAASDVGLRSIEHLGDVLISSSSDGEMLRQTLVTMEEPTFLDRGMRRLNLTDPPSANPEHNAADSYDPVRAAALFTRFVRNRTWHVPTLRLWGTLSGSDNRNVMLAPMRFQLADLPRGSDSTFVIPPRPREHPASRTFRRRLEIVGAMHRAGVAVVAGTDAPNVFATPGFSLHDELGLLVAAGLTPRQALQSATREAARFLGALDSLGTIAPGKVADLVLLDADPLADIANTRAISAVIVRGRVLDRSSLLRMLDSVAAELAEWKASRAFGGGDR